jgi:hypothetical protein
MDEQKLKSLLQYKSSEMIPTTQLIRKSKQVFDSIQNKDIDKAVILRDGKPSFMLIDFGKYEEIINYFINNKISIDKELELLENIDTIKENKIVENKALYKDENKNKKTDKDLLLEKLDSIEGVINNDKIEIQENLKDFWE